ncbi:MAG: hypothetical protein L0387_01730 [Acidobacteria bacterium]|nr:hypothetical protein [Acidobacteriota bacterium]
MLPLTHRKQPWLLFAGFIFVCGLLGMLALRRTAPARFVIEEIRNYINYIRHPPSAEPVAFQPIAPSPLPLFEAQNVVSRGKLYVFGGFVGNLKVTARSDIYDPSTDTWTRIGDMPIAVTHAGFAVDGDTVWMAGGFLGDHPGKAVRDVWKYDTAGDRWTPGPALPEERASGGLALLGRELHFIGGLKKDRQTDSSDHWVLSLDGDPKWTAKAPMPVPRNHMAVVAYEGRIYALGGVYGHDGISGDLAVAHVYDPLTDNWREVAPLRRPRSHFEPGTFIAGGRIVIVGGRSDKIQVLYDITAYDPARDVWQELPSLPVPLRAPLAKAIGNEVIIGQGGALPSGVLPRDKMIRCTWEALGLKDRVSRP